MCHHADHWILWHVDRTLQTNAETVQAYLNSGLISFHSLIAISMFVLWCILHLQYPSIISCFFLCSCFELENKQGFGSVILDNYIVPICSNHFFLLDERGSNSQHPTNLWGNYGACFLGLRSIGFMILGASTDSTPVSPLSSFPIHSYSYSHVSWKGKGHKGSADGPMLLMSPSNLRNSGIADPEVRRKKLNAELANGRLAMFAIIGMFFQEPWICMEIFGGFLKMGVPPNHPKLDYLLKPMVLGIPYLKKKHFK